MASPRSLRDNDACDPPAPPPPPPMPRRFFDTPSTCEQPARATKNREHSSQRRISLITMTNRNGDPPTRDAPRRSGEARGGRAGGAAHGRRRRGAGGTSRTWARRWRGSGGARGRRRARRRTPLLLLRVRGREKILSCVSARFLPSEGGELLPYPLFPLRIGSLKCGPREMMRNAYIYI
jgi:hypothetical protein